MIGAPGACRIRCRLSRKPGRAGWTVSNRSRIRWATHWRSRGSITTWPFATAIAKGIWPARLHRPGDWRRGPGVAQRWPRCLVRAPAAGVAPAGTFQTRAPDETVLDQVAVFVNAVRERLRQVFPDIPDADM